MCFIVLLLTNTLYLDVAACNINLTVTDTKQYVATEGYPYGYKDNQDCEFNFMAPSGRKFIVMFEDFDLEEEFDFIHFRKSPIISFATKLTVKNLFSVLSRTHQ